MVGPGPQPCHAGETWSEGLELGEVEPLPGPLPSQGQSPKLWAHSQQTLGGGLSEGRSDAEMN